jgi:acyl carrier protein
MTTTTDERLIGTDVTELITSIYRETLGDDSLDADSDFFEAGGDSLSAFQITARLQETLGADVPVALVFAYPSPADLATVVESEDI